MQHSLFRGTATALVTPFRKDGSVDFETLGALIDRQIAAGIAALVPCGSTGESSTLSIAEKLDVIRFTVEHTAKRAKVIAGTGSNNTQTAVDMTTKAKELGVDGVLLVCPYYNRPTQQGLIEHHKRIAGQVDIPQLLYNIPARSGVNILAETQLRIAEECPNVVGTKEASGRMDQVLAILAAAPEGFAVYAGDDLMTLPITCCGGAGVISVSSNIVPGSMAELTAHIFAGRLKEARQLQHRLLELMQACNLESNPIPVKAALAELGLIQDGCRLPLIPAQQETRDALRRSLQNLNMLQA